ncbi:MAG: hypothetical protein ABF479_01125 [Gluconacetobacter sp.]
MPALPSDVDPATGETAYDKLVANQLFLMEVTVAQGRLLAEIHAAVMPKDHVGGESATALIKELIKAVQAMHDDIKRRWPEAGDASASGAS